MTWTTPADLKAHVQKLWDRGVLLASLVGDEPFSQIGAASFSPVSVEPLFPRRLPLKKPNSRELSERFDEVRHWIATLSESAGHYRLEWRTINHRVLGTNAIPSEIWLDTLDNALALIGKRNEAKRFETLVTQTHKTCPALLHWLAKRPLRALQLAENWTQLLSFVVWLTHHPRPQLYLRQIALPGIHTKLLEAYRADLMELLNLVLPHDAIDATGTGVSGFCRRYGFLDKPLRVRFRLLDPHIRLLPGDAEQDMTVTQAAFASLQVPVSSVFITENEVNFLAFPEIPDAMVLFGAGYGFDNLAAASWLREKSIWYWGDIDTHGFAILNQLRGFLPHASSLLMDERTLLTHRALWGSEPCPETGNLARLLPEECALYDQLRQNHWGERVRLEQERIGFDVLCDSLQRLWQG